MDQKRSTSWGQTSPPSSSRNGPVRNFGVAVQPKRPNHVIYGSVGFIICIYIYITLYHIISYHSLIIYKHIHLTSLDFPLFLAVVQLKIDWTGSGLPQVIFMALIVVSGQEASGKRSVRTNYDNLMDFSQLPCRLLSRFSLAWFFQVFHIIFLNHFQTIVQTNPGWWFQPLWKIWVRQLGSWHSQLNGKS